jgi:hypothetical protein
MIIVNAPTVFVTHVLFLSAVYASVVNAPTVFVTHVLFLSEAIKSRVDAKDFARTLYNQLTLSVPLNCMYNVLSISVTGRRRENEMESWRERD